MTLGEHAHLRALVAASDAALERLDTHHHVGAPTLEREALRQLRDEHETIKALLGELAVEGEEQSEEST